MRRRPRDDDPNYVYGEGRIDAKAAVDLVKTGGTLSGTVTDAGTIDRSAAPRSPRTTATATSTPSPTRPATTRSSWPPARYAVTATRSATPPPIPLGVTIRPTRRPTRTSRSTALPRFTVSGHVRASEDGSPIAGRAVRAIGTPVPPATTDAAGAYSPRAADRRLHAARLGRRLHRAGRGRRSASSTRTSPRTSRCSASSTTSATAAARSRSTGSTRPTSRRCTATSSPAGCGCRSTSTSTARPTRRSSSPTTATSTSSAPDQFNVFPIAIPSPATPNAAIYAFWQDLSVDARARSTTRRSARAPNRAFVIEYSAMQVLGSPPHVSLRDQALGGRPDRPALRQQPGQPG